MQKKQLLLVEWEDITTDDGWLSPDENHASKIVSIKSVGWKIKSDRQHLVITPMLGINNERCNDRQIIPRGCIRSIRRLE